MMEKRILDGLLRDIQIGTLKLVYWDGEQRSYGQGEPKATVRIKTPAVVRAAFRSLSLAFGEAYMRGDVEVAEGELEAMMQIVVKNRMTAKRGLTPLKQLVQTERNVRKRQQSQISRHYDVGNDYYRLWLDPTMMYSCAYFRSPADSLEQAQRQKIDHLLRKLRLERGQGLLDIGSGWGHLAVAAAKQYGARVLGVTLSREQLAGAQELAAREGVEDLVRFELKNYQDLGDEQFDRVISVGMFEHVGRGQHANYFRQVRRLLVDGGVSVLHTITAPIEAPNDPWVDRYIFPGGYLPTVAEIEEHLAREGFWSIDRENLWWHYARTLEHWRRAHQMYREKIIAMFDEPFYRMRDFWLVSSQTGFEYDGLGLAQIIFTKGKPAPGTWPTTREFMYKN